MKRREAGQHSSHLCSSMLEVVSCPNMPRGPPTPDSGPHLRVRVDGRKGRLHSIRVGCGGLSDQDSVVCCNLWARKGKLTIQSPTDQYLFGLCAGASNQNRPPRQLRAPNPKCCGRLKITHSHSHLAKYYSMYCCMVCFWLTEST